MTKNRDLKRRIRARMKKTGESYTAARRHFIASDGPDLADYPSLAGVSDAAVRQRTGRTWAEWVQVLDGQGGERLSHAEVAAMIGERWPAIGGWWAESVAIAYARIRGATLPLARPPRRFEATCTRRFARAAGELYRAVVHGPDPRAWIGAPDPTIASSTPETSVRLAWPDGTRAELRFLDEGPSQGRVVVVEHDHDTSGAARRAEEAWSERFDRLEERLGARVSSSAPTLAEAVARDDVEGALVAIAMDVDPAVEAWPLWATLDRLSDTVQSRLRDAGGAAAKLGALLRILYGELGFRVPESYSDPGLNQLDRVLATRRGTPAALAGLVIVLGRRAGLALAPVAFPGHFLVRAEIGRPVFVDPASGLPVPTGGLLELAADDLDANGAQAEAYLEPVDARALAVRLLTNLGIAYRERGQDGLAMVVADRLYELSGSASDRRDRGLHLWAMGALEAGREDIAAYLAAVPGASDADLLTRAMQRVRPVDGTLD